MADKNMLVSQKDSAGTEKYYLSEWSSEFSGRSPEDNPDIETPNPTHTDSITFRMQAGRTLINSRKRQKTPPQATVTTSETLAAAVAAAEAKQAAAKRKLDFPEPTQTNSNKKSKKGHPTQPQHQRPHQSPPQAHSKPTQATTSNPIKSLQRIQLSTSLSSDSEDTDSEDTEKFQRIIPAGRKEGINFDEVRDI
jgi:hypothetical protein